MAWFTTEQPALLAAVRHCEVSKLDTYIWQFAWTLTTFLTRRGPWTELVWAWESALRAAERLGDPLMRADAHLHLAQVNTHLHHYDQAVGHFRRALKLYQANGNSAGAGHTSYGMALLIERQGKPAVALRHARKAYAHFVAAGDLPGQAKALNGIAWCHIQLGHSGQALADGERALALFRSLGDEHGQADTLDTMGYARHCRGEHG
jgi:tetratricopeptide (TPR) repeat protein